MKFAKIVDSSWIDKVVFVEGELFVELKNGKVYAFKGVPQNVAEELVEAGSIGNYFNKNIKEKYEQVAV